MRLVQEKRGFGVPQPGAIIPCILFAVCLFNTGRSGTDTTTTTQAQQHNAVSFRLRAMLMRSALRALSLLVPI